VKIVRLNEIDLKSEGLCIIWSIGRIGRCIQDGTR
jgi:hypothetical protein